MSSRDGVLVVAPKFSPGTGSSKCTYVPVENFKALEFRYQKLLARICLLNRVYQLLAENLISDSDKSRCRTGVPQSIVATLWPLPSIA